MTKPLVALVIVGAIAAGGCGGSPDGASESLQTGVYEWELSDEYLIDHGIPSERAVKESGHQEITLWKDGTFLAAWRTADNSTGSCRGTYDEGDDRQRCHLEQESPLPPGRVPKREHQSG